MEVAAHLLRRTEASLVSHRGPRFASALESAKEMCEEMNMEAVLKQERLQKTKRQFCSPEEEVTDALQKMEISFFSVVVDVSITTLQERFQTWVK